MYLGHIFAAGLGVDKDLNLALIYYEKFINNVEKHSFMLSDLVKCFTDILWERLATQDNNLIRD